MPERAISEHCSDHSGHVESIRTAERERADLWKAINALREDFRELRDRPPKWALFTISFLTFIVGVLATIARGVVL